MDITSTWSDLVVSGESEDDRVPPRDVAPCLGAVFLTACLSW